MSSYPYWSLHFVMRDGTEVERRALEAVALGRTPDAATLATIHPAARYYLADPVRFLDGELEPRVGSPVRLSSDGGSPIPRTRLSIEIGFHDDHQAMGGWMFWVWVYGLVLRPDHPRHEVIGYEGIYRNDDEMSLVRASREGIEHKGLTFPWQSIDEILADWGDWDVYAPELRA